MPTAHNGFNGGSTPSGTTTFLYENTKMNMISFGYFLRTVLFGVLLFVAGVVFAEFHYAYEQQKYPVIEKGNLFQNFP